MNTANFFLPCLRSSISFSFQFLFHFLHPSIFAEAIKYKRFKTLIPKYFDSDSKLDDIQHIYYMDIDM